MSKLRERFDRLAEAGCGNPNCECAQVNLRHEEVYLHSKCHPIAPFFLGRARGNVAVVCCMPQCSTPLITVPEDNCYTPVGKSGWEAMVPGLPVEMLDACCHPHSAFWVTYRSQTGRLKVLCYECQQEVAEINLDHGEQN